ncbi:hypothetical protein T11_18367 [Trichinella zimbabwensis]|uniref:Uncharacterized protein n=1 Tax=Trichinella zimbabwensis TaxID=268475 RepID=A0A0V1HJ38_9BILA|nr:hypothetical protein T11_18367 [Trichinella zimbabwensis]
MLFLSVKKADLSNSCNAFFSSKILLTNFTQEQHCTSFGNAYIFIFHFRLRYLLKFYALALLIAVDIFFKFPFLKEMQFVLKSINNEQYGKLPKLEAFCQISNSLEKRQLAVGAQYVLASVMIISLPSDEIE